MMTSFRNPQVPLSFRCYDLLNKENFVDCTLVADNRFLQCHKLVLAAASTYFEEIFNIIPDKHPAIVLKDISYKHLQLMLQYVYCGNVDVEKQEIDAFSKVLDSLKVEYDLEGSDDAEENDEEEEQSEHQQDFSTQADTSDHEQYNNDNDTDKEMMDIEEPKWNEVKIKEEPTDDGYNEKTLSIVQKKVEEEHKVMKVIHQPKLFRRVIVTHRRPMPSPSNSIPNSKLPPTVSITPTISLSSAVSTSQGQPMIRRSLPVPQQIIRIIPDAQSQSQAGKFEGKIHLGRVVPNKALQRFMQEHQGICPFCKKHFKTPKHRNEHVKYCFKNPNRIVSVCPLCDKNVCDPYYLRKHMKNVHGTVPRSDSI